jgi:hypothetical protein
MVVSPWYHRQLLRYHIVMEISCASAGGIIYIYHTVRYDIIPYDNLNNFRQLF